MSSYGAAPQPYVVAMPMSPSMQQHHSLQQDYAMRSFASQMQRVPPYSPARAQGYTVSPQGGRFGPPPPPGFAYVIPTPVVSPRLIAQQRSREAAQIRQRSPVQSPVRTTVPETSAELSDAPPTYLVPTESSRLKNVNSLDMSVKQPRSTSPSHSTSYAPQSPTLAGSDSEIVSMPAGELRQLRRQVQELRAARLREHDLRETSVSDGRKAKTEAAAARIAVEAKEAELRVAKAKLLEISHLLRQVSARAVKNEPLTGREMHQISIAVQAVHPDMLFGQLNAAAQQAIASATRDAATAMMLAERANAPPSAPSPLPFSYAARVSPKAIAEAMTFSPGGETLRSRSPNQGVVITSSQLSQSATLDRDRIKRALLSEVQVELQAASVAASQHFTSNGAADLAASLTSANTSADVDVTSLADEILGSIDSAEARSKVAQNSIKATLYTVNDLSVAETEQEEVAPEPVVVVVPSISPKKQAKPSPLPETATSDGLPVKRPAGSRPTAEEVLPPSAAKSDTAPPPPPPPAASAPVTKVVSMSASPSTAPTKVNSTSSAPPATVPPAPAPAAPAPPAPVQDISTSQETSSKLSPPLPEKRRIGALSSSSSSSPSQSGVAPATSGPPSRPAPPLPDERAPEVPAVGPPIVKTSVAQIPTETNNEISPPPPPPPSSTSISSSSPSSSTSTNVADAVIPAAVETQAVPISPPAVESTTNSDEATPSPPPPPAAAASAQPPAAAGAASAAAKSETKPAPKWGPGAAKKTEDVAAKKDEAPAKVTPAWMQKKNAAATASAPAPPSTSDNSAPAPPPPPPPAPPAPASEESKSSPTKPAAPAARARPGPPPPIKASDAAAKESSPSPTAPPERKTSAPPPPERKTSAPPPPPPASSSTASSSITKASEVSASATTAATGEAPRKPSGPPPPPARKPTPPPSRSGDASSSETESTASASSAAGSGPPPPPATAARKAPPPPSKPSTSSGGEENNSGVASRKAPPPPSKTAAAAAAAAPATPEATVSATTSSEDSGAKKAPPPPPSSSRSAPPPPPAKKASNPSSEDDADANFSVKKSPVGQARSAPPPPPRR